MDNKKEIEKLEMDLSSFLIGEIPRARTERSVFERQSYLYKGLNIYLPSKAGVKDKVISVRIGALEAQYSITTRKRISGSLMPDDDHNVKLWLNRSGVVDIIKIIYNDNTEDEEDRIMPFDLEEFYTKDR